MDPNNPYANIESPTPRQASWWSRNWKWFVPVLILVILLITCFSCIGVGWRLLSRWDRLEPIPQAMQAINQDQQLIAALGQPIETGTLPSDMHFNYTNHTGTASATFPIVGPNDRATVQLDANYDGTQWTFDQLIITIDSTGEQIDLSNTTMPSDPVQPGAP